MACRRPLTAAVLGASSVQSPLKPAAHRPVQSQDHEGRKDEDQIVVDQDPQPMLGWRIQMGDEPDDPQVRGASSRAPRRGRRRP